MNNNINDPSGWVATGDVLRKMLSHSPIPINTAEAAIQLWGPSGEPLCKRTTPHFDETAPSAPRGARKFAARFTATSRGKRRATARVSAADAKANGRVGGSTVYGPSGEKAGRVVGVTKNNDGSCDVDMEFPHAASWQKVDEGAYVGVHAHEQPAGGTVLTLTDRLSTDESGLPKFERLSKADDGRDDTLEAIRQLHKAGGRALDPQRVRKGESFFDTPADGDAVGGSAKARRADQLAKGIMGAVIEAVPKCIDPLDAIRAIHRNGAQKCVF